MSKPKSLDADIVREFIYAVLLDRFDDVHLIGFVEKLIESFYPDVNALFPLPRCCYRARLRKGTLKLLFTGLVAVFIR